MSHSQLCPQLAVVPGSVLGDKSRALSACSLVRGGGGLEGSGDFSSDTTSLFCCMDDRHKPAPSILPALTGHTSCPPSCYCPHHYPSVGQPALSISCVFPRPQAQAVGL